MPNENDDVDTENKDSRDTDEAREDWTEVRKERRSRDKSRSKEPTVSVHYKIFFLIVAPKFII